MAEQTSQNQSDTTPALALPTAEAYTAQHLHQYADRFAADLRELADRVERLGNGFDAISGKRTYSAIARDIWKAHHTMLGNSPLDQIIMYAGEADHFRGRGE